MKRRSFFTILMLAWVIPLVLVVALTRNPITAYFARQAYWLHSARGSSCFSHEDYPCAEAEYEKMITLQPDRVEGYERRGQALLRLTRYSEAAADDTAALSRLTGAPSKGGRSAEDLRTMRAQLLCDRGKAEAGMGHYSAALTDITQAIHLWPEIDDAHTVRMQVSYQAGKTDAASADADYVIQHQEMGMNVAYVIRSKIAARRGRFGRAAKDMAEACRLQPGIADQWFDLGWMQLKAGEASQAVATYKEALIHDPDRPSGWFRLCIAQLAAGDSNAAMETVNTALPRSAAADRTAACHDLADVYHDYPSAADQFDRANGWFR